MDKILKKVRLKVVRGSWEGTNGSWEGAKLTLAAGNAEEEGVLLGSGARHIAALGAADDVLSGGTHRISRRDRCHGRL